MKGAINASQVCQRQMFFVFFVVIESIRTEIVVVRNRGRVHHTSNDLSLFFLFLSLEKQKASKSPPNVQWSFPPMNY